MSTCDPESSGPPPRLAGIENLVWTQREWLDEACAWIRERVDVAGAIEHAQVRPWATILRVPTTDGRLFFKAVIPEVAYEVPLTQAVAAHDPDLMPPPVATDSDRGWMILVDGGGRLREAPVDPVAVWEDVLPRYAQLQIAMRDEGDSLVALGVPDRRLARLPELVAEVLDEDQGLAPDEHRALVDALPRLRELCDELRAGDLPETVQHDDLHDANVLVRDGVARVFDWGDTSVSHAFMTLRVTLKFFAHVRGLPDEAPELARMRDSYLAAWSDFGTPDELREAYDLAFRIAIAVRALSYHQYISLMPAGIRERYAHDVPDILRRVLAELA